MNRERHDYRQELTDNLIARLEQGTAPWQKPWTPGVGELPYNPVTGTEYRGANSLQLALAGYADPRWATYKQAETQGWQVRRGEKGSVIEYWKFTEERPVLDDKGVPVLDDQNRPKKEEVRLEKPQVFRVVVFNATQMDNAPELEERQYTWNPVQRAEAILANSGASIHHDQGDRALYRPSTDTIHLPARDQFASAENYYATALHELGHWTGHESRLNRDLSGGFGSEIYAKEELRAELASYFLSNKLGIPHDPEQHAAYVGSWIKALREDKNEIYRAARDAEKIVEHVMSLDIEKQQAQSVEKAAGLGAGDGDFRVFLAVPYSDRHIAKEAGAQWDKSAKLWYAPSQGVLDRLQQYVPDNRPQITPHDPRIAFGDALRSAGLIIEGMPSMDGQRHRVPVQGGKAGATDGFYIGYLDGVPAGNIQNFKTGYNENWKFTGMEISSETRQAILAQAEVNKAVRQEALEKQYIRLAEYSEKKWNGLAETPDTENQYLKNKQVRAHGVRFDGDKVVVPLRDVDGNLWSLQSIAPDGQKHLTKNAKAEGHMHVIGGNPGPGERILIASGYATGASLHEATGLTVVVAISDGNLERVGASIKEKFPGNPITIAGDDDVHNLEKGLKNSGREKAEAAAHNLGVSVTFPKAETGISDFNDVHVKHGLRAVKEQLEQGISAHIVQSGDKSALQKAAVDTMQQRGFNTIADPESMDLRSSGPFIAVGRAYAIQSVGGNEVVIHDLSRLEVKPEKGQELSICYHGGIGLNLTQQVDRSAGQDMRV